MAHLSQTNITGGEGLTVNITEIGSEICTEDFK